MSFLVRSLGIPSFKKALFSFWFRVSSEDLAAVRAAYDPNVFPTPQMAGVLPVMLFGPRDATFRTEHFEIRNFGPDQTIHDFSWSGTDWGLLPPPFRTQPHNPSIPVSLIDFNPPQFLNPGFIGIDCTTPENIFVFRFPYGKTVFGASTWAGADIGGETYPPTVDAWNPGTNPPPTPPGPPPYGTDTSTHILRDKSFLTIYGPDIFAAMPEFGAQTLTTNDHPVLPSSIGVRVVPGHWHNVILGMDYSTKISVEGVTKPGAPFGGGIFGPVHSTSKMWLAFDDVNRTGTHLSYFAASNGGGGGPNDILTTNAFKVNGTSFNTNDYDPSVFIDGNNNLFTQLYDRAPGTPTYKFTPPAYPTMALYIPGDASFPHHHVEMAELQIFTGRTLDTGSEANRRLIINKNGKPELKYAMIDKLLGKPVVRLHGSANWAKGKNTGTGGHFTPSGKIPRYRPDPSLHGAQSPADLKK